MLRTALQLGENVPASSVVLYALYNIPVRPRITRTIRTVDGGIQRNNENHSFIERNFLANLLWCDL